MGCQLLVVIFALWSHNPQLATLKLVWKNLFDILNLMKNNIMTTSELKLQIFRQIDLLDKSKLNELSGIVSNLVHGQYGTDDWENLSNSEKEGIIESIKQLDGNSGSQHDKVMKRIREKIANVQGNCLVFICRRRFEYNSRISSKTLESSDSSSVY